METIKQRHTSAADTGVQKPAGARSSVFDVAKPPPRPRTTLDVAAVKIRSGVPIPAHRHGPGAVSGYETLLKQMKAGDCVTLPEREAGSMLSRAKKLGITCTRRVTGPGEVTIWRMS